MQLFNEIWMTIQSVFAVVLSAVMAFCPFIIPSYRGLPAVTYEIRTVPVYAENAVLLTLAEDGASGYRIVHGQNAYHVEVRAAQELQRYFERAAGALLPIVTDTEPAAGKEIVIGRTNRAVDALVDQTLYEDSFQIVAVGETLLIAGGETRGTLFGVYAFLEEFLGCRWFTPELEVVPELSRAVIPADIDVTQTPAFGFRHTSWWPAQDTAWRARMKLNGSMTFIHGSIDESYTDLVMFGGSDAAHTFNSFMPPAVYFANNPEYFALQEDGTRSSGQPCLSHPAVLALTKAGIARWIDEYPRAKYLSVSQNDNWFYCKCAECAAIDAAQGSPAGSMIHFVNKVADYVKHELGSDVLIHTLAYQYTVVPPKNLRPAENVAIQLCSIDCSHHEPYKISNPRFVADVKAWSEHTDNLLIWDYNFNFAHYHTPFPDLRIIQPNVQTFYENGAVGFYGQGNTQSLSGEFGELRAYMVAKLMWNPYLDMERLMEEFLYFYYGPGYKNIQKYIAFAQSRRGYTFHIGSKPIMPVLFNPFDLARAQAYFDACAAAGSEAQRARTERSALQLRYYASAEQIGVFFPWNSNRIDAARQLHEDFVRLGITHLREGPRMMAQPDYNLPADQWSE